MVGAGKGIWIFRAVLYGASLPFIAWHYWPQADAHPSVKPVPRLTGLTSQGRPVALGVNERGARSFATTFGMSCTAGPGWTAHWWPADGPYSVFRNSGRTFSVHEWSHGVTRNGMTWRWAAGMTGRLSADRRAASGQASFIRLAWVGKQRRPTMCGSRMVNWRVRR